MQLKVSTTIPQDVNSFLHPVGSVPLVSWDVTSSSTCFGHNCPLLILLPYSGYCEHCTNSCTEMLLASFWMFWVLYHGFLDVLCTTWGSITFFSGYFGYCIGNYHPLLATLNTACEAMHSRSFPGCFGYCIRFYWILLPD